MTDKKKSSQHVFNYTIEMDLLTLKLLGLFL